MKLQSQLLPGGIRRAFHAFTPALQFRIKSRRTVPVMAVRESADNFDAMRLYEKIEVLGPSSCEPLFQHPLPGTNGRGVAIMFTEAPLRVYWRKDRQPVKIQTETRLAEVVMQEVLQKYGIVKSDVV